MLNVLLSALLALFPSGLGSVLPSASATPQVQCCESHNTLPSSHKPLFRRIE